MVAFFGCMYYAALRPEEATDLRRDNLASLPDHGWGEMLLTNSEPRSGSNWTDDGTVRQRRELKHRAPGETRSVPIHPELVILLRNHLKQYGTGPNGRIFTLPRGGTLTGFRRVPALRGFDPIRAVDAVTRFVGAGTPR